MSHIYTQFNMPKGIGWSILWCAIGWNNKFKKLESIDLHLICVRIKTKHKGWEHKLRKTKGREIEKQMCATHFTQWNTLVVGKTNWYATRTFLPSFSLTFLLIFACFHRDRETERNKEQEGTHGFLWESDRGKRKRERREKLTTKGSKQKESDFAREKEWKHLGHFRGRS